MSHLPLSSTPTRKPHLDYKEYHTIFGPFPSDTLRDTNSAESVDTKLDVRPAYMSITTASPETPSSHKFGQICGHSATKHGSIQRPHW